MNELHNALEDCLQAIDDGQKIESVLARYPGFEKELRPLLEVSLQARDSGNFVISEAVKHRGRVRLLQRANELRKVSGVSRRRMIPLFPRLAMALGLVGILVLTSTGFVSASSGTLPGDQLYPVKRTWEGVRLFFAFNSGEHDLLESQFEQERLDEIGGLLGKKIAAPIEFTGLVTRQANGRWQVSGIPVSVTGATNSPGSGIPDGAPVTVVGITRSDGVVEAQKVQLLQAGGPLPPFGLSENRGSTSNGEIEDGNNLTTPVAVIPGLSIPGSQKSTQQTYQYSGVVQSQHNGVWVINGQSVSIDQAVAAGGIKVGSAVRFEGYYGEDGKFIITKVEIKSNDNLDKPKKDNGGAGSGNNGSGGDSGGDNGGSDDGGD